MNRVNRRNYYRLLHVQHDAPTEVIKASYRTIMQKLKQHPDLGGDAWNASLLNEAYTTLCDKNKRARYDQQLGDIKSRSANQPREAKKPKQKQKSQRRNYGPAHCPFCQVSSPGKTLTGEALLFCRVCDSPLIPIKETTRTGNSKRSVKRIPVRGQLKFISSWPQEKMESGKIQDLSPKGLKFCYTKQLKVNSLIKIDSQGLKAVGRIVSCISPTDQNDTGYKIGVEFITLSYQKERDVEFS